MPMATYFSHIYSQLKRYDSIFQTFCQNVLFSRYHLHKFAGIHSDKSFQQPNLYKQYNIIPFIGNRNKALDTILEEEINYDPILVV